MTAALRTHLLTHMTRAPTVTLITPTETIIAWICHLSLSLSLQYRHCTAPISTLHAALHDDLMYVSYTNSSFPNRLPCSVSKSSSSSSFTSKQRCLVYLSYCTAQLHVLQSSIRLNSLHHPIHHLSSFKLQDLLLLRVQPHHCSSIINFLPHEHLHIHERDIYIYIYIC